MSSAKASFGPFMKFISITIVIIFIIWGIGGDVWFRKSKPDWIIKVGNIEYTPQNWIDALNVAKIKTPSLEGAPKNELYQAVITDLVDSALLLHGAEDFGFSVGDDAVRVKISSMKVFHDDHGVFNKDLFLKTLAQHKISERNFLNKVREEILREDILSIFHNTNNVISNELTTLLIQAMYAKHNISLFTISNNNINYKCDPTKQQVEDFWKNNTELFMSPEKRHISYIFVDINNIKKEINVSDNDIKQRYERDVNTYSNPERRDVEQIIFPSQTDATHVYRSIKADIITYNTAAKQMSTKNSNSILRNVSRDAFSQEISSVIFSLKDGEVSRPLLTPLGWHIFKINKIYPEHIRPLTEVSEYVRRDLITEQSFDILNKLMHDVEKDVDDGANIKSIAQTYNLPLQNMEAIASSVKYDDFNDKKNSDTSKISRRKNKKQKKQHLSNNIQISDIEIRDSDGVNEINDIAVETTLKNDKIRALAFGIVDANVPTIIPMPQFDGFVIIKINDIISPQAQSIEKVRAHVIDELCAFERAQITANVAVALREHHAIEINKEIDKYEADSKQRANTKQNEDIKNNKYNKNTEDKTIPETDVKNKWVKKTPSKINVDDSTDAAMRRKSFIDMIGNDVVQRNIEISVSDEKVDIPQSLMHELSGMTGSLSIGADDVISRIYYANKTNNKNKNNNNNSSNGNNTENNQKVNKVANNDVDINAAQNGNYIAYFARVNEIKFLSDAELSKYKKKHLVDVIRLYKSIVLREYMASLAKRHTVEINYELINKIGI